MIRKKLQGYKKQDSVYEIFSPIHFITEEKVIEKLEACKYQCYYCNSTVKLVYGPRDSEQWTLDRINNSMGQNTDNVLISCLGCNLKRRNRDVNKFLFTKRLVIKKLDRNV